MLMTFSSDPKMEEKQGELQITTLQLLRLLEDPGTAPCPGLPSLASAQAHGLHGGVWFSSQILFLCSQNNTNISEGRVIAIKLSGFCACVLCSCFVLLYIKAVSGAVWKWDLFASEVSAYY